MNCTMAVEHKPQPEYRSQMALSNNSLFFTKMEQKNIRVSDIIKVKLTNRITQRNILIYEKFAWLEKLFKLQKILNTLQNKQLLVFLICTGMVQ